MKQKIAICCCCLLLSGCPKYADYSTSSVKIAQAETKRIEAINNGLERIAGALVRNSTPSKRGVVETDGLEVSVTQTGVEWMARMTIARDLAEAYRAAVMFKPVDLQQPATTGAIGLEVAKQATGLAGIVGGVVAFSNAMRPTPNVSNAAGSGGTIGSGAGTNAPSTTTTETTIGGQE